MTPLKAIRKHCIECMGGTYQLIEDCTAGPRAKKPHTRCPLYPFRMGTIPGRRSNNPTGKGGFPSRKNASKLNDKQKGGA